MENMSKEERESIIRKKLGIIDRRSIINILYDNKLCNRIISEKVIGVVDFSKKYDIPVSSIKNAGEKKIISIFGNSKSKGSKKFVFEDEALKTFNSPSNPFYIDARPTFLFYDRLRNMLLKIAKVRLTEREYQVIEYTYSDGLMPFQIGDKLGITAQGASSTLRKAERKILLSKILNVKFNESLDEYTKIKSEYEFVKNQMDMMNKSHKEKFEKIAHIPRGDARILAVRIIDLDLSVRSLNVLNAVDIDTVGDLIQYKRNDLLRFRNFGKVSLQEIDNLLDNLGLEYNTELIPRETYKIS